MPKQPMNMIAMLNKSWDLKNSREKELFEEQTKNLISHSYSQIEIIYKDYCKRKFLSYDREVFILFQRVFLFITLGDRHFLQDEYDTYCKYCKWANFKPLSTAECVKLFNRLSISTISKDLAFIVNLRPFIDPDYYYAMVLGFCNLALIGDGEIDQNEYYLLKCFFEKNFDLFPRTWEELKSKLS